jgi:heme-degrading monooxygenase HmoA
MLVKHITFSDVDRAAWEQSQATWLEMTAAGGGLSWAYGAESGREARAVFRWTDEASAKRFQTEIRDRAEERAGKVGRVTILYLDPISETGTPRNAGFVAESISWIREGMDRAWLDSQQAFSDARLRADGFVGGFLASGRRMYTVTSFWRDREAHDHFLRAIVPHLRARWRTDDATAKLIRFRAPLVSSLRWPAAG